MKVVAQAITDCRSAPDYVVREKGPHGKPVRARVPIRQWTQVVPVLWHGQRGLQSQVVPVAFRRKTIRGAPQIEVEAHRGRSRPLGRVTLPLMFRQVYPFWKSFRPSDLPLLAGMLYDSTIVGSILFSGGPQWARSCTLAT